MISYYSYALPLLLFETLIFKTSDLQLDLLQEQTQTCKANIQEQLRTIHQTKKAFKEQGLVLGTQTQETLKAIGRFGLYHTRLCA
jgi:hypothetical protein